MQAIRKAVFPLPAWAPAFCPPPRPAPKEMLPIVDKPLIQYAVEEALEAGMTDLIFITGRNKRAIEDHFDKAYELETELEIRNKEKLLEAVQGILPKTSMHLHPPARSAGLGHAVLCARPAIGNEPFAVLLADDLIDSQPGALQHMVAHHQATGASVLGVETVAREETGNYGIVEVREEAGCQRVVSMVENLNPKLRRPPWRWWGAIFCPVDF